MAKAKAVKSSESTRKIRPALTPEARENQLISLAYDLVEKRLLEGTASSQETTHFLKLGTEKARLEKEKLKAEVDLATARTESLQSAKRIEELYANALNAMKCYGASSSSETEEEPDDDYEF